MYTHTHTHHLQNVRIGIASHVPVASFRNIEISAMIQSQEFQVIAESLEVSQIFWMKPSLRRNCQPLTVDPEQN